MSIVGGPLGKKGVVVRVLTTILMGWVRLLTPGNHCLHIFSSSAVLRLITSLRKAKTTINLLKVTEGIVAHQGVISL